MSLTEDNLEMRLNVGITLVAQIHIHKNKLSLVKKKTKCTGNSINIYCQIMFETVTNNLSFFQCTKHFLSQFLTFKCGLRLKLAPDKMDSAHCPVWVNI
jgi:hypothetical protein